MNHAEARKIASVIVDAAIEDEREHRSKGVKLTETLAVFLEYRISEMIMSMPACEDICIDDFDDRGGELRTH